MVRLLLSIKAELENVTDLVPEDDSFEWFFQVKCNSCYEVHPKFVSLNRMEEHTLSSGKDSKAHFVWRCGLCKRESSAKFEASYPTRPYSIDSNSNFAPVVVLDCRGLEFVGFEPRGTWKCVGAESGTAFAEIDLSEGEWTEYDEKAKQPVGIMNIDSKWERAP